MFLRHFSDGFRGIDAAASLKLGPMSPLGLPLGLLPRHRCRGFIEAAPGVVAASISSAASAASMPRLH